MRTTERTFRPLPGAALLLTLIVAATACAEADRSAEEGADDDSAAYLRPTPEDDRPGGDTIPGHPSWTLEDWSILETTVSWARGQSVDTLPIGERIAALGRRFVGTDYVPQTLEAPGEEGLVINFRGLDCVTFIENMMALAHFLERAPDDVLDNRREAMDLYEEILTSIRYRGGTLDGYPSRLHYFTEWLWDNAERGHLELVTQELGGVADPEPIDFMTEHRDSYRQLADPAFFEEIGRVEERLSGRTRYYIPQEEVASVADSIRTGDVIAATSTLEGLDIAHTGIALWEDGVLKLMHAPLVGEDVQISEQPLADRLLGITAQDGIMVARPLEPGGEER